MKYDLKLVFFFTDLFFKNWFIGNTLSEAISSKASTSLEFSKYSETQPLLQHDPNSDESFKKKFQEYADDGKRCETRILTATKAERKTLTGNSLVIFV